MKMGIRNGVFSVVLFVFLFATLSHHLFCLSVFRNGPLPAAIAPIITPQSLPKPIHAVRDEDSRTHLSLPSKVPPDSILFPDWEVVVLLLWPDPKVRFCLYPNGLTSPAVRAGDLPFAGNRTTFKCILPRPLRRHLPFPRPFLVSSPTNLTHMSKTTSEMFRWNFLVYESISTVDDVILFAKGVNQRQGFNVPASNLRCVFSTGVKTPVTSSSQEVFRCLHPDPIPAVDKIKISLEMDGAIRRSVPSVAHYSPPPRTLAPVAEKALLCACTMGRNVGKFLQEWVAYHSSIGVEKFILYDNGSDDDVDEVTRKLLEAGFNLTRFMWAWPKTQEAGFSHCATSFKDTCTWMMFTDIDEFVFSPSWANASSPSKHMLRSILPSSSPLELPSSASRPIGQVSMVCYEFGPSDQKTHPKDGVTRGYTCRRRVEHRHKSIVLLEAMDPSLLNFIHHFKLKEGFGSKRLPKNKGVINHYKYQAWPEFKTKFNRRVSAYVNDWTQATNMASNDRTPGLGHVPAKPDDWESRFCEVNDTKLMEVTKRWFGREKPSRPRTDGMR